MSDALEANTHTHTQRERERDVDPPLAKKKKKGKTPILRKDEEGGREGIYDYDYDYARALARLYLTFPYLIVVEGNTLIGQIDFSHD